MRVIKLYKKFLLKVKDDGLLSAILKIRYYYQQKKIQKEIQKKIQKEIIKLNNALLDTSCGLIHHKPLVSLIAVNFNGSKDLAVFLASIQNQSYSNYELILVDNNSTDGSQKIIESARARVSVEVGEATKKLKEEAPIISKAISEKLLSKERAHS